jgi:uncharacterized protein (TIGR03085 family)
VTWAEHERAALVEVLTALGPDAPTLCEGWRTSDLAAHCYVRERRPDAALGVLPLGPLSAYTERVMASALRTLGYDEIVRRLAVVPAFLRVGPLDDAMNTVEYFVHTEDVRRPNGMPARELPAPLEDMLWRRLTRQARLSFRRVPARVRLERVGADATPVEVGTGELVEVRGRPGELMLLAYNRKHDAKVDLDGSAAAVDALQNAHLGL